MYCCEQKPLMHWKTGDIGTGSSGTGATGATGVSMFCYECMKYYLSERWAIIKDNILKMDCLADLKRLCQEGVSFWIRVQDVARPDLYPDMNLSLDVDTLWTPVDGTNLSGYLNPDITETQRVEMVRDFQALVAGDSPAPTFKDIQEICEKYWP